jgi:hypothetical protein
MHRRLFVLPAGLLLLSSLQAPGQGPDVAALVKMLKNPFDVKKGANGLGKLGFEGRTAVGDLAEALQKARFESEKVAIADAMEKILGACHTRAVDLRPKFRKNKDLQIGRILDEIDAATDAAVPALGEVLGEARFKEERTALSRALGACGPAAKPAVPVLAAGLKIGFSESQVAAAEALGKIGPSAKEAIPALLQVSKTGLPDVRKAATAALVKIQKSKGK